MSCRKACPVCDMENVENQIKKDYAFCESYISIGDLMKYIAFS